MPSLTFSITSLGLELPVLLGVDQVAMHKLQAAATPIPRPVAASALVDTGTDMTCIDSALLQQIGATKTGSGSTQTVSGQQAIQLFRVSLSIPSHHAGMFVIPSLRVMELPVSIPKVDVLFGMDLLSQLRVVIDGPRGTFEIHY